jgi:signal transduction histidine kinase/ligand-binding sensor domain-containing protein
MLKNCWIVAARWVLLLFCGSNLIAAQDSRYPIDGWDTEKGLPEMAVFSVTQTHDGYLWVGTGDGLARFDGVRFRRYEENNMPGLSGSKVVKLFEDRGRHLWVATETSGVMLIDPDGKVLSLPLGDANRTGPLVSICEDRAGSVWFRMAKGQVYWYAQGKAHQIVDNCRALVADDSGLIWIASQDGRLIGMGPVGNALAAPVFTVSYEFPAGSVDLLVASKRGGYWCLANGRIQKWKLDHLEKDFGPYPWNLGAVAWTACEDSDGNLIVGTFGDGVYWQKPDGQLRRVDGLPHSFILSVFVDHEGSLWVGSNGGGLNRVKRQSFDVLEGTAGSTVKSVCEDHGGGLWIGHNSDRIDHWTGNVLKRFTGLWTPSTPAPAGLTRLYAQTVFADRSGQVWAGGTSEVTTNPPLLRLRGERFEQLTGSEALNLEVWAIHQDRQGVLWVGTQGGLARWNNGSWKIFTTRDGLSSDYIRAIADDAEGNLWIGTERGGLNRLHDGQFTAFHRQAKEGLPSDNISSLHNDEQGILWIGTSSGLARYDRGQWTTYSTRQGLASDKIGYLIEDGLGYLWIGSNGGLMRIAKRALNEFANAHGSKSSLPCRTFGRLDGLPTSECSSGSQPAACRTTNGMLYLPTISGLVTVDPARLSPNTNPPPVVIEGVRIDGELVGSDNLRAPPLQAVTVSPGKESVEILFSSLNLSAPEKGAFKYLMEGYETVWNEHAGTSRYASYTKLPPGHFTFHVTACNEDGVWNEKGAALAIVILPPFWRTWWFITGSSILLLSMIVGSVHYVSTQKLQRQLALMRQQEALEKERSRIARDLHDQLGANLTQVALLGEMAETDKNLPHEIESHARQISQTARETTRSLDEIVWTVNPSNDTLDGLINYVCKYAQEYLALAGLRYRLEVPPQLPALPISPELRHNVFLAVKEAVNNVVKHSHASSAWVRLQLHPDRFVLEIEDDGRGLPEAATKKGRNGLRNMRYRMEDIGGQFEVSPREGGGTKVSLTARLKP